MDNKEITLPNGLISAKPVFSEEQMQKFSEMMNSPEYQNHAVNQIQKQMYENLGLNKPAQTPKNQMVEEQKKLNNNVEQLKPQLVSIQYENMKLNAQIEELRRTIEFSNEKINDLQAINKALEENNQILKDSNKHYWRNTFFISLVVGIISFILGMYTNEIKSLFLSLLNILK